MAFTEYSIARAIALQTLARKCIVLVDNCNWTGHECDVLGVTTDLRIIDVEVKISRADLKADAKKEKWWHRHWNDGHVAYGEFGPPKPKVVREWPLKVWKHYYAVPRAIWNEALFEALPSPRSGVLLLEERGGSMPVVVECARRSTPNKDATQLTPKQAIDIARLANLRMWDAYHRLDRAIVS